MYKTRGVRSYSEKKHLSFSVNTFPSATYVFTMLSDFVPYTCSSEKESTKKLTVINFEAFMDHSVTAIFLI